MNVTERTNKAITGQYGYQGNLMQQASGGGVSEGGHLAQSKALDYQESINKHRKKAEVVGATLKLKHELNFKTGKEPTRSSCSSRASRWHGESVGVRRPRVHGN